MVKRAEALTSEHTEAIATQKLAQKKSAETTKTVIELQRSEAELRQQFTKSWAAFVGINPPEPAHTSLLDDWRAFADWARTQQRPLEQEYAKALRIAETATSEVTQTESAIRELVAEHEGTASCEIAALLPLLIDRMAEAKAAVEHAERRRKELEREAEQVKQLEESQQVHDMLGNRLLKSSGFEQWLMEEVLLALVGRASERLLELSGGQYSIESKDMDFMVRDHRNGDELRDARTLSGGETFLASLALALALADSLHAMAPAGTTSDRVAVSRRGVRHARPRDPRCGCCCNRRAGGQRSNGRRHHPHPRTGRADAGAVRGHQTSNVVGRGEGRGMKFAVETWAPEYGIAADDAQMDDSSDGVAVDIEVAADKWVPIDPTPSSLPSSIMFVDGVRRIDARVWITDGEVVRPGVCATVAAGSVLCTDTKATVIEAQVVPRNIHRPDRRCRRYRDSQRHLSLLPLRGLRPRRSVLGHPQPNDPDRDRPR